MDKPEENKVIDIWSRKPHMAGQAYCVYCKHEWAAVADIGALNLLCPECKLNRGAFKVSPFPGSEGCHFRCNSCDNSLFIIVPEGAFCLGCGITHDWFTLCPPTPSKSG